MAKSRRVTGPLAQTNSDDSVPRNLIDFAVSLSHEGMFAKACRILVSSGLAPNNEDTWKLIREKHPEGPLPIIPETTSAQSISLNDDFDVYNILKSFPKGTAAGPSGLRVQHLLDADSIPLPRLFVHCSEGLLTSWCLGKFPRRFLFSWQVVLDSPQQVKAWLCPRHKTNCCGRGSEEVDWKMLMRCH